MIWGAFSANGKAELVDMEERLNAQKYVDVLQTNPLPFIEIYLGQNFTFQQDNASIHTANVTKAWFKDKNVTVQIGQLNHPISIQYIVNLWSILSRQVYIQGKQFETKKKV